MIEYKFMLVKESILLYNKRCIGFNERGNFVFVSELQKNTEMFGEIYDTRVVTVVKFKRKEFYYGQYHYKEDSNFCRSMNILW